GQRKSFPEIRAIKRNEKGLPEIRQSHHQKAKKQKAVFDANEREITHGGFVYPFAPVATTPICRKAP
ncbi:MAG: hypothetical protein VXV84_01055, partial [Pseudomonadota bacterium]|nr:hypothetical protein [Pseudomonadota bacterium]